MDATLPWRCPTCGRPATLLAFAASPEPSLACELACEGGHRFGSVEGILQLCEASNYADSFGREWLAYTRTQVDRWNGTTISRDRFFQYTGWPRDLSGQTVLEAGSGSGRFTQVLLDAGARVASFDYSAAVIANAQNNAGAERLTLFRGDVYRIPFAPGSFDRVVCIGVLQHTPDPEGAFRALARMVKPGGHLAADIYRVGAANLLSPKYPLRLLRRFLPADRVVPLARRVVPALLPVKAALRRVPLVGVPLAHLLVPVADYRGRLPLSDEQARTWSELELIDALTPEHDHPATRGQVARWCREAGLVEVSIEVVSKGGQLAIRALAPS
ncbi:MAG TPA: class I SAM-dependent methyltransferase [Candidatus Nanopelagicales bacterium]|nr:class I SAM-dependent methyltransferase [Candidatus Nanopelagicales bacterium]